jgi:hypothetical protein
MVKLGNALDSKSNECNALTGSTPVIRTKLRSFRGLAGLSRRFAKSKNIKLFRGF